VSEDPRYDGSEIAVCGMAGRFPGAPDVDAYWRNLRDGVDAVTRFSLEEVAAAGEDRTLLEDPDYVPVRPVLEGVELFDAGYFGLTPREAEVLDPQHRLFLESAVHALEHAAYDPERVPGTIGLFAGASFSNYLVKNLYKNRPVMEAFGDLEATIHNVPDSLATLVGYKLDLRGPCCAVQTFCSTSLVAVHLACQSLLNFETDLALAGGVTVFVPQRTGYLYREGSIVSRAGRCRAFDASADGTVFGNGVGVVVLRRLKDATADGATVHALVRGSAVNNDGSLKVSFAAPGVVGQTEVVVEALSAAGVDAGTIGYVEAHGTGTRLGDPAEVKALTNAFRAGTARRGFCALGSVKTNVGHLDAAAGIAGFIKAVLAVEHGQIPPSLHYEAPNPAIDFASTPFYVNASLREWPGGGPRRAGVSAFGVGGTNAHVVLEQAPAREPRPAAAARQILVLSAKTETALDAASAALAAHLAAHPELELADVAFTLQVGRSAFAHRRYLVCDGLADAIAALDRPDPTRRGIAERRNPPVVFRSSLQRDDAAALERRLAAWGIAQAEGGQGEGSPDGVPPLQVDLPPAGADALEALGRVWLAGVDVDWAAVHAPVRPRRVPLPGYPFERERYWVDPVEDEEAPPRREPSEWLYRPVWKSAVATAASSVPERTLVFADRGGLGRRLAEDLRVRGGRAVLVTEGSAFGGDPEAGYTMDPARAGDYVRLWEDLARRETLPAAIVHAWSVDPLDAADPRRRLARATVVGFDSLRFLAQALSTRPAEPLSLAVVSTGLHDVFGDEPLEPEKAPLLALCRVWPQEQEHLRCRSVDVDAAAPQHEAVLAELAALGRAASDDAAVAWRRGRRWVQAFERFDPGTMEAPDTPVRDGGVYLVTGGLGGVGFVLAAGLVRAARVTLVLVGRKGLPPAQEWDGWLQSRGPDDSTSVRIRKVRALRQAGAAVDVVAADVADAESMGRAVAEARRRFGRLDGVVHAAGEMSAETFLPVRDLTSEACARQFAPKVLGSLALDAALAGQDVDFVVVTSSLSSILGGFGYGAYAAANAFQDAFATARSRGGARWLSVDWDHWRLTAEAARLAGDAALGADEGLAVFERALRVPLPRIAVSTTALEGRLERWVRLDAAPPTRTQETSLRARPALSRPYLAPRDEHERRLAGIWQELLGLDRVGVHDDFFELGGHSLFAARALSRMRAAFGVSLPLEALFAAPTIAELAPRVAAAQWASRDRAGSETSADRVEIEI
jgi:acyl transferase domain-containing protein